MMLENNYLKIEYLPHLGGKISSIYDKQKKLEFLFQNPNKSYKKPTIGDDFSTFDASGFDDTFPSIDEGEVTINDQKILYPDHGEIWTASFEEKIDKGVIKLKYNSKILPYTFQKNLLLKNNSLKIRYKITNTGKFSFPCFYTFHCLIDSKEGVKLITDKHSKNVTMLFSNSRFNKGDIISYPITNKNIDLSNPSSLYKGEFEKFYFIEKVKKGKIGYNYTKNNTKLLIYYNEKKLPYLGFWNTQGGFRSDYNFALEMSNG
ncbi:MAG: DUF5107 domain-containing protein, partial [Sphaerochaetaceae bacterium]|nr:DUF5107 domain-containing protein [Sphaerochaetaceae bacterium]